MEEIREMAPSFKEPGSKPSIYILQGASGSGKSYLAALLHKTIGAVVCEADHYMVDDQSQYRFDKTRLSQCHHLCQMDAIRAMDEGKHIVISNTNIKAWECRPYVEAAMAFGYDIHFLRLTHDYGSIHGVREGKRCAEMMDTLGVETCMKASVPAPARPRPYVSIPVSGSRLLDNLSLIHGLVKTLGLARMCELVRQRRVQRGNELHITLLPPKHDLPLKEVLLLRERVARGIDYKITGAGIVKGEKGAMSVYLVVELPDGLPPSYPHITLEFDDKDVHDQPKTANVPAEDIPDPATRDLCLFLAHPCVSTVYHEWGGVAWVSAKVISSSFQADDLTYMQNPELYESLPRGWAYIKDHNDGKTQVLRGMRKFYGLVTDETVDAAASNIDGFRSKAAFFTISLKENGAAGNFKVLKRLEERHRFLMCVGTKLTGCLKITASTHV